VRLPALAVLLDWAPLQALGGDRSDEQSGHGDGGDGDRNVTQGVFSLMSLCRNDLVMDIPRSLFTLNLYSPQRY
jgi:hypothetical protein